MGRDEEVTEEEVGDLVHGLEEIDDGEVTGQDGNEVGEAEHHLECLENGEKRVRFARDELFFVKSRIRNSQKKNKFNSM